MAHHRLTAALLLRIYLPTETLETLGAGPLLSKNTLYYRVASENQVSQNIFHEEVLNQEPVILP